jgi:hypothetical protein
MVPQSFARSQPSDRSLVPDVHFPTRGGAAGQPQRFLCLLPGVPDSVGRPSGLCPLSRRSREIRVPSYRAGEHIWATRIP